MRASFIGGGVMAEAMLSRALASGVCESNDLWVAEPVQARRVALADAYGVNTTDTNANATANADLLIIAVKPQHIESVYEDLGDTLGPDQTVLSIAAGVPLRALVAGFRHKSVIRVMPNTPAQIGAGMSVWTATDAVGETTRESAAKLLGTLGRQRYVESEDYLDMATAISGSGPAYVFAFIEALVEAGVFVGMPKEMAQMLAIETALGAARLAHESGKDPRLLREMVTSPGGTTAAALLELERGGLNAIVKDAAMAALHRARELGGKA